MGRTVVRYARGLACLVGFSAIALQCSQPEALKHRAIDTGAGGVAAGAAGSAALTGAGGASTAGAAGADALGVAGTSGASGLAGADGTAGSAGSAGEGGAGSGAAGTGAAGIGAAGTGAAGVSSAPSAGGSGAGASGTAGAGGTGGRAGAAGTAGASGSGKGGGGAGGAAPSADAGMPINYCDRAHWKATASITAGDGAGPIGGIDGNLTTRWGNNRGQDGTDWYQVDFGGQVKLQGIKLDDTQTYPDDYPGGYAVYGSADGVTFDANPFVTGNGMTGTTTITFAERTVRAVKIKQTGTARSTNWWQIGELLPTCSP